MMVGADESASAVVHKTEEEREYQRMREAGCVSGDHAGPIHIRVTMAEELSVDKFCGACDVDVEGWGYEPGIESVEINLEDGQTERFTPSEDDDA